MSSLRVAAMVDAEPLLFARDVAQTTSLSLPDVRAAFEDLRVSGGHDVLYTVTRSGDDARVLLCRDAVEAERAQSALDDTRLCVYALRRCGAGGETSAFAPRRTRASLRPCVRPGTRVYPLLSRGEAEARAAGLSSGFAAAEERPSPTPAPAQRKAAADCPPDPPSATVKTEPPSNPSKPTPPPEPTPAPPQPEPSPAAGPPPPAPPPNSSEPSPAAGPPPPAPPPNSSEPSPAAPPSPPAPHPQSAAAQGKRQKTLFGATAGKAKQPRGAAAARTGSAEPKAKKPRKTKAADAGDATSLAQLAKLAKASGVSKAAPTASAGLLDEDEENSRGSSEASSMSESRRMDSALLVEDAPALDITLPASNDDVFLCDDAPPIVFCAPKREREREPTAPPDDSSAQPTLNKFFQPEVVRFQRAYTRETVTETVVVDGEYISKDRICYRHAGTAEVITEEEYHRRSAEFMRTLAESQASPLSPTSEGSQAAGREPAGGARPVAARVQKPQSQPVRTLMSYFNKTS